MWAFQVSKGTEARKAMWASTLSQRTINKKMEGFSIWRRSSAP